MKKELEALLALQAQDKRLRTLQDQLQRLFEQRQQLQATLDAEEQILAEERRRLAELQRLSWEKTAEVDDLDVQIRKYEHQLEEGLLSFKEMEALREKVQHSRQRMEQLEEEAIPLLERVEQERAKMAEREAAFAQWKSRMAEEVAEVNQQSEEQRRKIEEEQAKRRELAQHVDAALLERYERLRAEYEDPLVAVRDGRCNGCKLNLSETTIERVREGLDLVTCENCLRILY